MGGILLVLVIVNAFLTGWCLAQVKVLKRNVKTVARVQRDMARHDDSLPSYLDDED